MASQADALAQVASALERQARVLDRVDRRLALEQQVERRERELERGVRSARKEPRRLDLRILGRVPGLLASYDRHVPPAFIALEGDVAVVACPCGESPKIPRLGFTRCSCGRHFVFTGKEVRVWREPADEPEGDELLPGLA